MYKGPVAEGSLLWIRTREEARVDGIKRKEKQGAQ